MQSCVKCGCIKPLADFQLRRKEEGGKRRPNCEACRSSQSAASRYGTTVGEIEEIKVQQKNCCAICGIHADKIVHASFKHNPLVIDHDHNTNKVRGLLCSKCNLILGNADDSISTLLKAIHYLSKQGQLP